MSCVCHLEVKIQYSDVIMSTVASQITGVAIVYSTVCSGGHQRKHQSSMSLDFVRGIHRRLVNSPHKGPVTRKMFPFDDVIMFNNAVFSCAVQHEDSIHVWNPPTDVWSVNNKMWSFTASFRRDNSDIHSVKFRPSSGLVCLNALERLIQFTPLLRKMAAN